MAIFDCSSSKKSGDLDQLKSCSPTLKPSLDSTFILHVLLIIACKDAIPTMLAHQFTTRISENQKKDSSMGDHLVETCGTAHNFELKHSRYKSRG